MNHSFQSAQWLGLALSLILIAPAIGQTSEERFETLVREKLDISQFELQSLVVPVNDRQAKQVTLLLDGVAVTLDLQPSSFRAPGFRVVTVDRMNRRHVAPLTPETTYQGTVQGKPGSRVAVSIINGGFNAQIFIGEKQWGVQPASELDPDADPATHVVYRMEDVIQGDWACSSEFAELRPFRNEPALANASFGETCGNVAEIAYDADYDFYLINGANVPNTVADIELINNAMNVIYESFVDITHIITEIVIWTTAADPYFSSNSTTLLNEFRDYWNTNHSPASGDPIHRDVAHLMTGKNIDGNIIGVAWLTVICNSQSNGFGYGLSESRFTLNLLLRTQLTTHELGHNWSAGHCDSDGDCAVMCSGVGGCTGISDLFGVASVASITNHRNSRSCLTSSAPPTTDCNNNCIEDADELSNGTATDCNANGILDDCDFVTSPQDCNNNGILDECEDCNNNGLADECEFAGQFNATSGQQSPIGLGSSVQYVILSPPNALGDVTIDFSAIAQLATSTKYIEVTINNTYNEDIFRDPNTTDCPLTPESDQLVIPQAEYNALVGGGDLTIDLVSDTSLPFECNPGQLPWVSIDISYIAPSEVNDVNDNMIPDECDLAQGDNNLDGVVNVDDLLSLLAKWGVCADPCPEDTDLDGDVDVEDLLALLANWG
ncbi:MAG: M12 family metallo-peptidase [Planctomycetota bacterium]|nr:M12 family metallo-peptidase [Planctomycetota bacterium]